MNCEAVRGDLSLFLYGELSVEEEQALQDHVEGCQGCRKALEAEKALHELLEARELEPSPELLVGCRRELALRLKLAAAARPSGWLAWLRETFSGGLGLAGALRRPATAVALVALGFVAARWTSPRPPVAAPDQGGGEGVISRVRYVQPDPSGRVQIVLEETRQRVLTGRPEEEPIQRLLLAAAREANDPGLRVESVEILRQRSQSEGVRQALLEALQHDPNAGVRLKALEGLKAFAGEPEVRDALASALLRDQNPGVRIQAIDLLTQAKQQEAIVGVLQELLGREDNNYIRLRCQRALQDMNASVGTF